MNRGWYCRTPYMAHPHRVMARTEREARARFRCWTCEARLPRGTVVVAA